MKILLVEDDQNIVLPVKEDLNDQNYTVEVASDGQEALNLLEMFDYDIILLDVTLPKMDGLSLCRRLRQKGENTPILMMTAKDTLQDKVLGLDAGADDYLVKPFELQELSARIRALLRRNSAALPPILEWEGLQLNPSTCEVFYQDQIIPLSPKEYQLLDFFLRNPRRVFSRSQILDHLWSFDRIPGEATVKTHIRSLRQKLAAVGASPDIIETIYGLGYRLREKSDCV